MRESLTQGGYDGPRVLSLIAGLGMMVFSFLTIDHYYAANFPETIFEGSFCDISAFFNCDSSAFSAISAVMGVPIGWFGLALGALVVIGALFPSKRMERTNRSLALLNGLGIVVLLAYTLLVLGSLCLLCTGYYLFSLLALYLFWRHGPARGEGLLARFGRPSFKHLAVFGVLTLMGAWGVGQYTGARADAQSGGVASRVVDQFFSLPEVPWPSIISPYRTVSAAEEFEDAPIRIVEYADFLCPDCVYLHEQLEQLAREFEGKITIAFQFFPLEGSCNDVVEKDLHPGACELSYIAARDPEQFGAIHDEIFGHPREARDPAWRTELARRHGVEGAADHAPTLEAVQRIIATGAEYEKTSERYAHGIRSTPTMIVNNRMLIGTFPIEQLRAIFAALVDRHEEGERRFLEEWQRR